MSTGSFRFANVPNSEFIIWSAMNRLSAFCETCKYRGNQLYKSNKEKWQLLTQALT